MKSIALCAVGVLFLVQSAGASVTVRSVTQIVQEIGQVGSDFNHRSDLADAQNSANSNDPAGTNLTLQDSLTLPQGSFGVSGIGSLAVNVDAQNNIQNATFSGDVAAGASDAGAPSTVLALMTSVNDLQFLVTDVPVTVLISGTLSYLGTGNNFVSVQGALPSSLNWEFRGQGAFTQTLVLPPGLYDVTTQAVAVADLLTSAGSSAGVASVRMNVSVVPEPLSLLLVGAGVVGMLWRRRG